MFVNIQTYMKMKNKYIALTYFFVVLFLGIFSYFNIHETLTIAFVVALIEVFIYVMYHDKKRP